MFDWDEMKDASDAFHVSIAWALEAPSQKLVESTNSRMSDEFEEFRQTQIKIEEIKSKVGNVVSSMPLRKSVAEGKGLFGL
jgi:U6 snRNA phosphodiesterase